MTQPLQHPSDQLTFSKAMLPSQSVKIDALVPLGHVAVNQAPDSPTATILVIRFLCLHCGVRLSVPAEKVGKWVRCKACEHRVRIPNLPPEPGQPRMTTQRVKKRWRRERADQPSRRSTPLGVPSSPPSPPASTASPLSPRTTLPESVRSPAPVSVAPPEPLAVPQAPTTWTDSLHQGVEMLAALVRSLRFSHSVGTSSLPLTVWALYADLVMLSIIAGGIWWGTVAWTGMDRPWLAMLPGVLLGWGLVLRKTEALSLRQRPALAMAGMATMLTMLLILGTTQQAYEIRQCKADSRLVQHAMILHLIESRTLPAAMQQEIDARRWYNPQDPEAFFSADILPIYEPLKALAQASMHQMSRGELHQVLGKFLRQRDRSWTFWNRRVERVNLWVGVWGLLGMGFVWGLPLLCIGASKHR